MLVCLCSFAKIGELLLLSVLGGGGLSGFDFASGLGPKHISQNDLSTEFLKVHNLQFHILPIKYKILIV